MSLGEIAVVGGGIGGLCAATALAQRGFRVTLFEAAPAWAEVGAGITLASNAMRGLDHIGVGEAVVRAGYEPERQAISHWRDGRVLMHIDRADSRERYGAAYVCIHRADLHAILVAGAERAGVTLELGRRVVGAEVDVAGARVHFADGATARADFLIGADGLKSPLRQLFEPKPAHFTGHVAYRALAPVAAVPPELVSTPGIHIGPERMVVRYPLRHASLLNLVFFARQQGWTEDGWSIRASLSDVAPLFDGWCDDVQALLAAADPSTLHKWAVNAHQPLEHWSLEGRMTLLGDAAHAMTPFLGQGAGTAIEDAIVLARALEAFPDPAQALERYEAARMPRTRMVQAESNANADRLQGDESDFYGLGCLRSEETLGLLDYDCTEVAL